MKTLFIPLLLVGIFSCNGKSNSETKDQPVVNDLPVMQITFLDGVTVQAKDLTGKTMLVFFFPDCEHCQEEANAMKENINAFKDYTVYYLSSVPKAEVEKFALDYGLSEAPNFKFGTVPGESVLDNFGPIPTPSMYIYNDEKKLVKKFEGQTPIETVINAL